MTRSNQILEHERIKAHGCNQVRASFLVLRYLTHYSTYNQHEQAIIQALYHSLHKRRQT